MAFIYCSKCDWQQDDFYSEHYNPAKHMLTWNRNLFGDRKGELDEIVKADPEFIEQHGHITTRELIAREFEACARKVRRMRWMTYEDWKKDHDDGVAKCPDCGSTEFGID